MNIAEIKKRLAAGRKMERLDVAARPPREAPDDSFDLIETLGGTWTSQEQGWNLIALPFRDSSVNYRLLMNQYGETLTFEFADRNIPNRGIDPDADGETDQLVDALDYEQLVTQVDAADSPESDLKAENGKGIHHEPGLFLQMLNHQSTNDDGDELNIARLATIPHGNSVLALGKVERIEGPPKISDLNALPSRVDQDLGSRYLAPYKHFEDNPFFGTVPGSVSGFPGFFPTNANAILQFANPGSRVKRTTILHFDTKFNSGGIVNIPFIERQADATEMVATFWVMELEREDESAAAEFVMQYSQNVFLDFFESREDPGQLIRWPHVSINTLRRA